MKKKMNLATEIDLTQDSVVQLTCWCGQIALHELWGLGRVRLDRITRRQEQLGNESLAVVMVPDRNGMPQTEKARQLRAEALPEGVPVEFRVPALRAPRTRREQQLKMVGDRAATMAWQLMALACVQELGFGAERRCRFPATRCAGRSRRRRNRWTPGPTGGGVEMGASKYIYTVYDAKTGEYVAKGTAAQLAGKGIFKDAGSVSTCYLSNRKTDKPRRWRMERVEVGPLSAQSGDAGAACSSPEVGALLRGTPQSASQTAPQRGADEPQDTGAQQRRVYIYRVWDMAEKLLGEGTAKELAEQGVFGGESTVRDVYRRGGKSERFGVGKMIRWWEVRPCPVKPYKRRGPNRRPEEKPELCKPCKIPNPTPLQLDVHDLCLYNRKARKQGKPELSYGGWAAKGKPGRP